MDHDLSTYWSLTSSDLLEAVRSEVILGVIVGSALLGFWQEHSAANAVDKLRARISLGTVVVRGGQALTIPTEEVVRGDIVQLSAGSLIPADGVLLETQDLFVNQAMLTGETFPVEKSPGAAPVDAPLAARNNCVYMGTSVRSGQGSMVVVQTGSATAFGQIAERRTLRPPETEFEHGLRRFGILLTQVMLALVFVVFAANVFAAKPPIDSLLFAYEAQMLCAFRESRIAWPNQ